MSHIQPELHFTEQTDDYTITVLKVRQEIRFYNSGKILSTKFNNVCSGPRNNLKYRDAKNSLIFLFQNPGIPFFKLNRHPIIFVANN